jgi:hypothetical protein
VDVATVVNFALTLGAQESWVRQDDCAKGRGYLAPDDGRSHAAHRVAQQNRSGQLDESNDIA